MPNLSRRIVLWPFALLLLSALGGGCSTYKMGQAATDLNDLARAMSECRGNGFRAPNASAPETPDKAKEEIGCRTTAAGLAKLSEEAASAGNSPDVSRANGVFYFRVAAMAAWLSGEPSVRDNVFEYTSQGRNLCPSDPPKDGIQQGDCALHLVLDSLAAYDFAIGDFNALKTEDEPSKFFEIHAASGLTALQYYGNRVYDDGMKGLVAVLDDVCRLRPDPSVIDMMRAQYKTMRSNLEKIAETGNSSLRKLDPGQAFVDRPVDGKCIGSDIERYKPGDPALAQWTPQQLSVASVLCAFEKSTIADKAIACPAAREEGR